MSISHGLKHGVGYYGSFNAFSNVGWLSLMATSFVRVLD